MKTLLYLSLINISSFAFPAFPAFATYNQTVCMNVAKQSAKTEILAHHPEFAKSEPEIIDETPDDSDELPTNSSKIYFSYGCKAKNPVSYLIVVTWDTSPSSDKCSVYYVWDVGADNAQVMCNWNK